MPPCPVLFNDVERCSVDFEGSKKCSVNMIKFLLFIDVVEKCKKRHFISNDESSEEVSFIPDVKNGGREHEYRDCDEPSRPNF